MDKEFFDFKSFASTLDKVRKSSDKIKYTCCIPGCNSKSLLHSHIIPQCVLKKYVCNDKNELIQCQIDEIHPMSMMETGEIPLEKFATVGIEKAMSLPLFCKHHDNDLFCEFEKNAEASAPYEKRFQILQALRAIGAMRHINEKLLIQNELKGQKDEFYKLNIYEEEQQVYKNIITRSDTTIFTLYQSIKNNDYSNYEFICIELDLLKIAICDLVVDEDDLAKYIMNDAYNNPLNALYITLLPQNKHSYLILGYNKKYVSKEQENKFLQWKEALKSKTDLRTIYNILCHCSNNWCISPDCDIHFINYLKENYFIDRMNVNFNIDE